MVSFFLRHQPSAKSWVQSLDYLLLVLEVSPSGCWAERGPVAGCPLSSWGRDPPHVQAERMSTQGWTDGQRCAEASPQTHCCSHLHLKKRKGQIWCPHITWDKAFVVVQVKVFFVRTAEQPKSWKNCCILIYKNKDKKSCKTWKSTNLKPQEDCGFLAQCTCKVAWESTCKYTE